MEMPTWIPTWVIEAIEEKIQKLEAENARLREALERIDNECGRDDTIAWGIANDALEALKGGE
jgi:predicted nuclease with TOPRIM domain